MEPDTWIPDISLVVEPYSSVWEPRIVLTEVKTGQYAELKDNQKQVMGAINNRLDTLVLRASVTLDSEEFAEIQYSTVESDADTKTGHRLSPFSLSP